MHDDVIDGLNWLIARGVADPDRVAIYGCSNGGCSALGASFTPDQFAAAIDYSGMVDHRSLVEDAAPFLRQILTNNYLAYMGGPSQRRKTAVETRGQHFELPATDDDG